MSVIILHPLSSSLISHPLLYPIFSPLRPLRSVLTSALATLLDLLVFSGVLYALLHRTGILKRLIRKFAEFQLSKIANGAQFTVGDIQVDILKGRAHLTDVVAHTPQRSEWMWDSPCIARAGTIDVTFNVLSCIDHVGPFFGFPAKDVHTVCVRDVQVFVEKRRNVFNFHLLDPSLDLPDAGDVMESIRGLQQQQAGQVGHYGVAVQHFDGGGEGDAFADDYGEEDRNRAVDQDDLAAAPSADGDGDAFKDALVACDDQAEDKANEIVSNVLDAVSTIGKAANEGGKEGLHTALMSQKAGFVSQLKEFKAKVADGKSKAALQRSTSSMSQMARDSISVMKQMSKAVEKNVSDLKDQVDSFQKPPPKKKGHKGPPEDELFRLGCVVVRDMRIFMMTQKNAAISMSAGAATAAAADLAEVTEEDAAPSPTDASAAATGLTAEPSADDASVKSTIEGGWSKPIRIKELAISGAELCPPMRSRDKSGMPGVGLQIDKVVDIIIKRLLAETAKTNSGRLLHTAFGEVFSWMDVKRVDSTKPALSKQATPSTRTSFVK
mmetsp:Transcript_18193/g.39385  ORF Transcript_18193/g.39385 Transcript_18193/m.39385 type:complete len:552 (-) Transcript_18193:134-1789(-)